MSLDLKLPDLPRLNLNKALLKRPLADLVKIKNRNNERWGSGSGSRVFENRKEKLRKRLKETYDIKRELEKIIKTEVGWQRLLMNLYNESNGQAWLPAFDEQTAKLVLGCDGAAWKAPKRRRAVNFFFGRYNTIPALPYLARQLRMSFDDEGNAGNGNEVLWKEHREKLFQVDAHFRVAQSAAIGETLEELMARHAVPSKGTFSVELRQVFLLKKLEDCTLGDELDVLHEIEKNRERPVMDALSLGSAALKILIERVECEARCDWKQAEKWRQWIVRLGCDPRIGRQSAEGAKWWGWATDFQLRLAKQGIIGLSLKVFFKFLAGTVSSEQWNERRNFLERLLDTGKIVDARLALNAQCFARLEAELRDPWITAILNNTTPDTCIIALHCVDDVYLLEGTHNFALRAFHREFPVDGFWNRERRIFTDSELRVPKPKCPIHRAHNGDWEWHFYNNDLRIYFHLEWKLQRRG